MRLAAVLLLAAAPAFAQDVPGIAVDAAKKTVTIDAKIAPRKLEYLKEIYPLEVVACAPHPKGKKAHETVVTIDVKPSDVHKALEKAGGKAGKPVMGETADQATGAVVNVYLELPQPGGGTKRVPIERVMIDPKTNKPMPKAKYVFTGSVQSKPDPSKPAEVYGADLTGTLIALFPVTNETVLQTNLTMKDSSYLKLDTNKTLLPAEGTAVKLILELTGN